MLIGYFIEYRGYKGTIEFDPNRGYYGSVQIPHTVPLKYQYFQRVEDMYDAFTRRVDDYLSGR